MTARLWNRSESGEIIQLVAVGRYVDRWSRRDGIWAIDHRHFVDDPVYTTVRPAPADAAEEESARNAGKRDPRQSADGGTARIRRTRCWDANRGWPGSSRPGPLGVRRPLGGVVMVVAAERMNAIPGRAEGCGRDYGGTNPNRTCGAKKLDHADQGLHFAVLQPRRHPPRKRGVGSHRRPHLPAPPQRWRGDPEHCALPLQRPGLVDLRPGHQRRRRHDRPALMFPRAGR